MITEEYRGQEWWGRVLPGGTLGILAVVEGDGYQGCLIGHADPEQVGPVIWRRYWQLPHEPDSAAREFRQDITRHVGYYRYPMECACAPGNACRSMQPSGPMTYQWYVIGKAAHGWRASEPQITVGQPEELHSRRCGAWCEPVMTDWVYAISDHGIAVLNTFNTTPAKGYGGTRTAPAISLADGSADYICTTFRHDLIAFFPWTGPAPDWEHVGEMGRAEAAKRLMVQLKQELQGGL